ncbi:MAG: hypothetical protein SGI77_13120 [Pirellulaceae bacterium]|nr:hypothetical protein [Pirellulaceae bacterium]
MKKKSKPSTKSTLKSLIGGENTCVFYCSNDEWQLVEDNSSEGYHCDPTSGICDSNEDTYITEDAIEDEEGGDGGDGGGDGDGGEDEMLASRPRISDLPKNSALYRYSLPRRILRRVRGAWAKGHYAPLEMTLKELAKFAPRVSKIVGAMAKDRCVASFEVIVPSRKRPTTKTSVKKSVAKSKK